MSEPDYLVAHMHSANHREEILSSDICGCFYCCKMFPPSQIFRWYQNTAACPLCDVDAVLGSKSGFPITPEFLNAMFRQWFTAPEKLPLPEPHDNEYADLVTSSLDDLRNKPAQFVPAVVVSRQVNKLNRPKPEHQTTECKSPFWVSAMSYILISASHLWMRICLITMLAVEGVKKLPDTYEEMIGNNLPNAPTTRFQWWMKHAKIDGCVLLAGYCAIMFSTFDQYIAIIGCASCGFLLRRIRDNNI